ncbi:hypothetical protein, partial [Victivallis vadensis]
LKAAEPQKIFFLAAPRFSIQRKFLKMNSFFPSAAAVGFITAGSGSPYPADTSYLINPRSLR